MSESGSLLLDGAIQSVGSSEEYLDRWLQGATAPPNARANDGVEDGAAFFIFAVIVSGTIGIGYIYCMFHLVRFWWCRRSNGEAAVRVADGFSFSLSSRQRRAVLETIFSDTSKAFFKAKTASSKNREANEEDDIPHTSTDQQTDADSVDLEANTADKSVSPTSDDSEMAAKDILPNDIVLCEIDCEYTIPPNQELTAGSEKSISTRKIPTEIRRKFPWQKKSPLTCCNNLSIPGLNEDSKMEEECEQLPKLCARPNFVTAVSFRQDESEGLDDDDDVCAICLNGYKDGETVISSKYCNHLFHKDCILEWLDNNDDCPCCRVDMVTSGDVSKATATIVGKTRMIKAVESIRVRNPPSSPNARRGVSPRARLGTL